MSYDSKVTNYDQFFIMHMYIYWTYSAYYVNVVVKIQISEASFVVSLHMDTVTLHTSDLLLWKQEYMYTYASVQMPLKDI